MKKSLLSIPISLFIVFFSAVVFAEVPTRSEITGTISENFYVKDTTFASYTSGKGIRRARLEERRPSGVSGGTSIGGSYNIRDINFINISSTFVNITGTNKTIVMQAADYYCCISATGRQPDFHMSRYHNLNEGVTSVLGSSDYVSSAEGVQTKSTGCSDFTIGSPMVYELQHYIETGRATNGLGQFVDSGEPETYSSIDCVIE